VGVIEAMVAVLQRPKYHERPAEAAKHENIRLCRDGHNGRVGGPRPDLGGEDSMNNRFTSYSKEDS